MYIKILHLIQIIAYVVVASQLIFYLMVLIDALKKVSLHNFLEQRQAVDSIFLKRYQPIYYTALLFTLIMVTINVYQALANALLLQSVALLCLVADITIARRKNAPINKQVNTYTPGDQNADWQSIRIQWLNFIRVRGIFIAIGLFALIVDLLS